MIFWYKL